jgi:UrcA family protein
MRNIALIAAAAAAFVAPAAHATADSGTTFVVRVRYGDLDVRTHAGAQVLMQRIAKAAAEVCGGAPDSVMHDDRVRFDRCRAEAYGRAVMQLDPVILTAGADDPLQRLYADAC